jgi:hypothetical protein
MLPRKLNKCGFVIIDEECNAITDKDGNIISFTSKDAAEEYKTENKIIGTVK